MPDIILKLIQSYSSDGAKLRTAFFKKNDQLLQETALCMAKAIARGNKILFCGNGGSAADCQHLAAEFVNRFLINRPALPAIALTTDSSILTAISNDFSFEQVFSKQILALGQGEDVLVAISTSGKSPNIISALEVARENKIMTIGLTNDSGCMVDFCDICFAVPHQSTPLIQEIHIAIGHILCRLVDYYLFENTSEIVKYTKNNN